MISKFFAASIFAAGLLSCSKETALNQKEMFPEELSMRAAELGLVPLKNMEMLGGAPFGRTYAFGYDSDGNSKSAVFWARKDSAHEQDNYLAIYGDSELCRACSSAVLYWNEPDRLTYADSSPLGADTFVSVDGKKTMPKKAPLAGRFIRIGDDNASVLLRCYEGVWYSAMQD